MLLTIIYYVAGATQRNDGRQRNVRRRSVCDCCRRNRLQRRRFRLVTNIAAVTRMRGCVVGVRAAASSWKPRSLAVVWMDGRSLTPSPVGWMEFCFNHPVVCCSLSLSLSLTTPTFPLSLVRLQPAIYASEQVCIGWHRTGACYTDKLTFPMVLPSKFGVRIIQMCVLYSNFYGYSSKMC